MYQTDRSGLLNQEVEAVYYVRVDDLILLASKAGTIISRAIATEWLEDPTNRLAIERSYQPSRYRKGHRRVHHFKGHEPGPG